MNTTVSRRLPLAARLLAVGLMAAPFATAGDPQKISALQGGLNATLPFYTSFGRSIAALGDVDGDGIEDMAVGAPDYNDGAPNRGVVLVLLLNSDGTVKAEKRIGSLTNGFAYALDAQDNFGFSVAGTGDLNGDGVPDLLIGAPYDDDGFTDAGAAYFVQLKADGSVKFSRKISATQGQASGVPALGLGPNHLFGHSVAMIGAVDGDGQRNDIASGAPGDLTGTGAVYSLQIGGTGLVTRWVRIADNSGGLNNQLDVGDFFGAGLAGPGDVNLDGRDDLAVGTPFDDQVGVDTGAVYLFRMGAGGVVSGWQKNLPGFAPVSTAGTYFAMSLGAGGDLNDDGVPDLIVGAPGMDGIGTNKGGAWILFLWITGGYVDYEQIGDGSTGDPDLGWDTVANAGYGLAILGDIDDDGQQDWAIGTPWDIEADLEPGAVWVVSPGAGAYHGYTPWLDEGGELAATTTPRLVGLGEFQPTTFNFVDLRQAAPNAPAWLVVGVSKLGQPFKGGTLVPNPDVIVPGLVTDAFGSHEVAFSWPAGFPAGASIWFQYWVLDAGGPAGFSASNGLKATQF